jgi:hypothetical protein
MNIDYIIIGYFIIAIFIGASRILDIRKSRDIFVSDFFICFFLAFFWGFELLLDTIIFFYELLKDFVILKKVNTELKSDIKKVSKIGKEIKISKIMIQQAKKLLKHIYTLDPYKYIIEEIGNTKDYNILIKIKFIEIGNHYVSKTYEFEFTRDLDVGVITFDNDEIETSQLENIEVHMFENFLIEWRPIL